MVEKWTISDGKYVKGSGQMVRDEAYGLHCSNWVTTLGCIKIHTEADILFMVDKINECLDNGEDVTLEVTED
jgi:hypothetical protein